MTEQITLTDYISNQTHNRKGQTYEAPEWMPKERCETCAYWEILPVELQPPDGWGVKGQCNFTHEPEMMKHGYWQTGKTSYCNDYKSKM